MPLRTRVIGGETNGGAMIDRYLSMAPTLAAGAVLLAALVALSWLSYQAGGVSCTRTAAAEVAQKLQMERAATKAALDSLKTASARGDTLSRQLATANRTTNRLRKERDDAIARATTGRVCLDDPALRVLDGAPGLRANLPVATGGVDGADAGHVATDTHVARWALDAGSQYDECRRRLDALIDWHEGPAR